MEIEQPGSLSDARLIQLNTTPRTVGRMPVGLTQGAARCIKLSKVKKTSTD